MNIERGDMLQDFKLIVHKLPKDLPYINLYTIADLHIGSQEFNEKAFKQWVSQVLNDDYGYFVSAGDLMNNGLKSSKTNVYEETMRPSKQKEYLIDAMRPIKDKWLAACGGNHEYRSVKDADNDPLYDVLNKLNIEDRYRQNACFVKINLGTKIKNAKQVSYGIVLTHGSSKAKHDKFINGIDGADVFVSGHTHTNSYCQPSKIRMDMQNENVSLVPYRSIVCNTFQETGGYGLRGEYMPCSIDEFQALKLDGTKKKINFYTI